MNPFDWEDFHTFFLLGQTLHLGRAAARLKISQVTVMRRVKSLEASLGTTLFVRKKTGHTLTSAGVMLMRIAGEAQDVLEAVAVVARLDQKNQGIVRIVTTEIGANWILLPQLAAFTHKHPGITLEIDASPHIADLMEDAHTLALRFRKPARGDYVMKKVGVIPFGLFACADLVACSEKEKDWSTTLPYVGWSGSFSDIGPAGWLHQIFRQRPPRLALTTMQGHINAAHSGIGVIGLPQFIGLKDDKLRPIVMPHESFALEAWLVMPAQSKHITKIRSTASFIEKAAKVALQDMSKS